MRQTPPYDFDFYQKYIQMEKSTPNSNEKYILDAYEDAIVHFGKENIGDFNFCPNLIFLKLTMLMILNSFKKKDLWLSYIDFKYSKSTIQKQNVSDIYWRAKRELNNDLIDSFTQNICLLKINPESFADSSGDIDMKYE